MFQTEARKGIFFGWQLQDERKFTQVTRQITYSSKLQIWLFCNIFFSSSKNRIYTEICFAKTYWSFAKPRW